MPENTGTQTYLQYSATEQTRLNVVYIGSNDGFLHGFRAGSFDTKGNFVANGTTPNDGEEVLAYMPGSALASAALPSATGGCTNGVSTQTQVQGIHGVTPAVTTVPECTEPLLDYANTQYGHNFFVDATPGSGDLFYGGQWHTWLVGGLGAGGAAIYALDVTNPSFAESNAPGIVIGEWNPTSLVCAIGTNCGNNLGNTFGTPQIRRLHNGNWAVIFGNGFGSNSGDAGIYIMSIDNTTGAQTFYYLSTNTAGGNGIAYATPADMDGDHITDYVYAGDLLGNVWRFDLTSNNPAYRLERRRRLDQRPIGRRSGHAPVHHAVGTADHHSAPRHLQQHLGRPTALPHRIRHRGAYADHQSGSGAVRQRHPIDLRRVGLEPVGLEYALAGCGLRESRRNHRGDGPRRTVHADLHELAGANPDS